MAFAYRTNTEVLYYKNAVNFLSLSIRSYGYVAYHMNYDLDDECIREECLPITKDGINYSTLAIINFACCAEACYNLAINEFFRENHIESFDGKNLGHILFLNISIKIQVINDMYNNIISYGLKDRLVSMADVRNKLVHYSEPIRFSGGICYDDGYMNLNIFKIFSMYRSVDELVNEFLECGILSQDIRSSDALIIGEGDITFDERISLAEKIRFVVRHPVWYIIKRIPQKFKYRRERKKIVDNLYSCFRQITEKSLNSIKRT